MKAICAEIQGQAAGLASLPADDPERRAACAHAVTCADCAGALAEGGAVLAFLDLAFLAPAPRPEALARAKRRVLDEAVAARDRAPRDLPATNAPVAPARPGVIASVWAALLLEWALLTFRRWTNGSGPGLVGSALLALAAAAIGAMSLRARRGTAAVLAVPMLSLGTAFATTGNAGPQIAIGIECAVEVVGAALVPLLLLLVMARRGLVPRPDVAGPAVGAAGALNAQAALRLACHAQPGVLHSLLFHSLPVILVGAACLIVARKVAANGRPPPAAALS